MTNNSAINCGEIDHTCEKDDDVLDLDSVALASGVYLSLVGIVSSSLNIMALIKATRVTISSI